MKIKKHVITLMICTVLLAGCSKDKPTEIEIGDCGHVYLDPLIKILSVKDSISNEAIPEINISSIYVNGRKANLDSVAAVQLNITKNETSLTGEIPCAFGYETGDYTFKISAPGYADTTMHFDLVDYKVFYTGCPAYHSGSYIITIKMNKQSEFLNKLH